MTKIVKLLFFVLIFFLFIESVYADSEFVADYNTHYSVLESGKTIVTQKITLTNKLTNIYPKQYAVVLDTESVTKVIAFDGSGSIIPEITKNNDKTQIQVTFNTKVVGIGKKQAFTLRYENGDIAQKNGSIWEINIPGIEESSDLGEYYVKLDVPPSFGPNAYLSPLPHLDKKWTKEQMIKEGISAAYGKEQYFNVNLLYYLENSDLSKQLTEIALPPDTAFQRVSIRKLEPEPVSVSRDEDGNWLARYELLPKQSLKVTAQFTVSVSLEPRSDYGKDQIIAEKYLTATQYWNISDPLVKSISDSFQSPKQIYEYTVENLNYDYERITDTPQRNGAVVSLKKPENSICMEFTDVFIALARASGIPARQAIGYAYTTNTKLRPLSLITDVLHTWPEYYDFEKQVWIPVDPTWAATTGGVNYFDKLDFNHITFAIHGINDSYPYPAGSYKKEGESKKNVEVEFADAGIIKHPSGITDVNIDISKKVISGIATPFNIIVRNPTGVGVDNVSLEINLSPENSRITKTITHLPPLTDIEFPLKFRTGLFTKFDSGFVKVNINGRSTIKKVGIISIYRIIIIIGMIILLFGVCIWIFTKNRKLFLSKIKRR